MIRKKDGQEHEDTQGPSEAPAYASQTGGTILFQNLPDDLSIFVCTGYTDLRKSIAGLARILEEDYETDSRSRCLTLFCGRTANRFKALLYDGDGYCLLVKYLSTGRLTWPRNGGRTNGEMWWLDKRQFIDLMEGRTIREEDVDGNEDVPEPPINTEKLTLFNHVMKNNALSDGIFLCTGFTDLRRSVRYLSSIVEEYGVDPQGGSACFLFMGKQADRLRALFYDRNGFVMASKTLDSGKYAWPRNEGELWKVAYSQAYIILSGGVLDQEGVLQVLRKESPDK